MLNPGARRLARGQAANKTSQPQGAASGRIETGVIATVTAGAAADGTALATVTVRGATQQAAHFEQYTPVVGHTVGVWVSTQGSILILDRIVGTPPS